MPARRNRRSARGVSVRTRSASSSAPAASPSIATSTNEVPSPTARSRTLVTLGGTAAWDVTKVTEPTATRV
ncbi:MAG TPA: hypothetical protein PLI44_06835, partial [Chiayiivirga sp.]|nr:hypothetical protein [Chiayiivirga sp.]